MARPDWDGILARTLREYEERVPCCCLMPGEHKHELPTEEDLAAVITQRPDQHLYEANLAQSDSEAPRSDEVDDSPNEESLPVKTHFDVAPAIPDDVKASMIGAAHDAAWSAVAARPAEGWRNSHDITGDPVMQKAHDDAHVAFDVVLGVDSPPDVKSASYCAAVQAATLILHWWATGRAVPSYHDFVPRPSATNEFGRDEFGTPRNALAP